MSKQLSQKEKNDKIEMKNLIKRCNSFKSKKIESNRVKKFAKENTKLFNHVEGLNNNE